MSESNGMAGTTTPHWIELFLKVGQMLAFVTGLCYLAGFVITNVYLGSLGITTFDILRSKYILVGVLFLGCMSLSVLSVILLIRFVVDNPSKPLATRVTNAVIITVFIFVLLFILFYVFTILAPASVSPAPLLKFGDNFFSWLFQLLNEILKLIAILSVICAVMVIALLLVAVVIRLVRWLVEYLARHTWTRQILEVLLLCSLVIYGYFQVSVYLDWVLFPLIALLIALSSIAAVLYLAASRPHIDRPIPALAPPVSAPSSDKIVSFTNDLLRALGGLLVVFGLFSLIISLANVLFSLKEGEFVLVTSPTVSLDPGWVNLLILVLIPYILCSGIFLVGYMFHTRRNSELSIANQEPDSIRGRPNEQLNSSQTLDAAIEGPKPDTAIEGPKPDTAIEAPKPDTAIEAPKPDTAIEGPKPDTAIERNVGKYTLWAAAAICLLGMLVPAYALGIYQDLPQEFGGGRSTHIIEVVVGDKTNMDLRADPGKRDIELLDRTSTGALFLRVTETQTLTLTETTALPSTQTITRTIEIPSSEVLGITYTTRLP